MSRSSSALRMIFGIVLCDLCNATERAMAVIPGTLAMVSKRGAAGFGEGTGFLSTAWHSEQIRPVKTNPASERLASCVQPSLPRSKDTITLIDPISRSAHFTPILSDALFKRCYIRSKIRYCDSRQSHIRHLWMWVQQEKSHLGGIKVRFVRYRSEWRCLTRGTREEFENFSNSLLEGHAAILNIAWIPRVKHEVRATHETAATRDGLTDYHIRAIARDGSLPISPERNEYFPKYYSTEVRSSPVYGLDHLAININAMHLED
jgi:CHASE domain